MEGKKEKPSSNGQHGRNLNGQFAKGNQLGKGNLGNTNLYARELKVALLSGVTEKDIKLIVKKMIKQAKAGDSNARKELFDRLWGRAIQEVDIGENAVKTITDILAIVGIGDESSNG